MDDACAEVILAEAKKGYGLLFLGLGGGSKATTHNFPPAIEKIVREFAGPIAILLKGKPRFNREGTHVNFIHHEDVNRLATRCTASPVSMAIKGAKH